jgi:hypothetical protein
MVFVDARSKPNQALPEEGSDVLRAQRKDFFFGKRSCASAKSNELRREVQRTPARSPTNSGELSNELCRKVLETLAQSTGDAEAKYWRRCGKVLETLRQGT